MMARQPGSDGIDVGGVIYFPITRGQERHLLREARRARIVERTGQILLHAIAWSLAVVFALDVAGVLP